MVSVRIAKYAILHTFLYSFAAYLLESGYDTVAV